MRIKPFKNILQYYLFILGRLALMRCNCLVVAIAGSTNKTFTKLALEAVLRDKGLETRLESYNTEIGLPLAILGLKSGYNSYRRWLKVIFQAFYRSFTIKLPKIVVLEFGSNRSGDLAYLANLAQPTVAIITTITQRYLEQFGGVDQLASEYSTLIKKIPARGLVVLNADIPEVKKLAVFSQAPVKFFSLNKESFSNQEDFYLISDLQTTQQGISGKLLKDQQMQEFSLPYFGQHHAQAYLAAQAVSDFLKL